MRSSYWDYWKGIAIVAVVLIHASNSTSQFPAGSFNSEFGVFLRQFINFPVGLFVFLAAFFAVRSSRTDSGYLEKVGRRIARLLVPYLVWSVVYTSVRLAAGNMTLADLPLALVNGNAVAVGYYVIVMVQLSLVSPVLERLGTGWLAALSVVAVALSCLFTYTVRFGGAGGLWGDFPYNSLPFVVWLPFYSAGLLLGRTGLGAVSRLPVFMAWAAVIAALSLSFVEAFVVLPDVRDLAGSQLKLTSILYSLSICVLAARLYRQDREVWPHVLAWIGRRSFYFYLSHMLLLGPFQMAMRKIGVLYGNQIAFVLLSALGTVAICAAGGLLLDRLFRGHPALRRATGLE